MKRFLAFLAVGALVTPGRSDAIDLSGSLGGGYLRDDSWTPGQHSGGNEWDWEATLAASGSLPPPWLVQWVLGADYQGSRNYYFNSTSRLDGLSGRGQLSLFPDTIVPLSVLVERSWTQFTDSDTAHMGATTIQTEGGTAVLRPADLPQLRLGLTRSDLDNHAFGAGETTASTTMLDVSASQSLKNLQYQLSYDTSWNGGTYAETNYQSHALTAQATGSLSDVLRFNAYDRYYLRDPTQDATTNPRYDDNALGVGMQYRPTEQTTGSLQYDYRDILVEVLDSPQSEQLTHDVTQSVFRRLTPELSLVENVSLMYERETSGAQELTIGNETLGGGFMWRHELSKWLVSDLSLSGTAGDAQWSNERPELTWSVAGSGGLTGRFSSGRALINYTGSAQSAAMAGGAAEDQRLLVLGERFANKVTLSGQILLTDARRQDPLLGLFKSDAATALLGATWWRYSLKLTAGAADGLADPLRLPDSQGGAILPASFDTQSRYVTATGVVSLDGGRLLLTTTGRLMSVLSPGRANQYEDGVGFIAAYTIGAFQVSLDDECSIGGMGPVWQRGNRVMLRIVRTLGYRL